MNLLLILSALLSALTGVGTRANAGAPAAAAVAGQAAVRVAIAPASRALRPLQSLPRLTAESDGTMLAAVLPAGIPLYLSRQRE